MIQKGGRIPWGLTNAYGANLEEANLIGAILSGARINKYIDFTGANLTGATWIDGKSYYGQWEKMREEWKKEEEIEKNNERERINNLKSSLFHDPSPEFP